MADHAALRARARAAWAAGDWDRFARMLAPIGAAVLERSALERGMDVLDVGTGSGGTIAIPAARRGARVVGADITPELLGHARRRAEEAGVEVRWVEADALALPFADASFDRVISTFGAMFAPDHRRVAAELVRVCRPGGRILMTTWADDGFAGELFKLSGSFVPPPAGAETPAQWGGDAHVEASFAGTGVRPAVSRVTAILEFASVDDAVHSYLEDFGPFVVLRRMLEPEGRWPDFADAFRALVARFDEGGAAGAGIRAEYLLVEAARYCR